jgi:hypothetical protein
LEEVLARLLYASGYRLLVSEKQDPEALMRGPHGLLVRGRGTDHQADVLGELTLPVPFSLPLRIFVEAKYRGTKSDLKDVRNAHGVVHDINEQYATTSMGTRSIPVRRYHYRYTLFSATGFTRQAQEYALAQQISLVDLSSPAFTRLLEAANRAAQQLRGLAEEVGASPFPRGQLRTALRLALGTWTADRPHDFGFYLDAPDHRAWSMNDLNPAQEESDRQLPVGPLADIAAELAGRARDDLLLGFPAAPFVLALRPDSPAALSAYVASNGTDINVNIKPPIRDKASQDWAIVPADGTRSFQIRFALPEILGDWLLGNGGAAALRAREVKAQLLTSIALFLDGKLVRLLFQPRRHS